MFVNLTPHEIRVVKPNDDILEITPSGTEIRISSTSIEVGEIDGVPCVINYFDLREIANVVNQIVVALGSKEVYGIVSTFVLQALSDHEIAHRLVAPDTSPGSVIRDLDGKIIGVKRFQAGAHTL